MRLVGGINDAQSPGEIRVACRDTIPVTVTVLKVNTSLLTTSLFVPVDLDAGRSLIFGAKPAVAMNGPYFVSQPVWTKTGTGVYTGSVEFTDALLLAAVGVNTTVALAAEFSQVDVAGNNYASIQFDLSVIPDVNRGGEPLVTRVSPSGGIWALEVSDEGIGNFRRIS